MSFLGALFSGVALVLFWGLYSWVSTWFKPYKEVKPPSKHVLNMLYPVDRAALMRDLRLTRLPGYYDPNRRFTPKPEPVAAAAPAAKAADTWAQVDVHNHTTVSPSPAPTVQVAVGPVQVGTPGAAPSVVFDPEAEDLVFEAGDPDSFDEFGSQRHVVEDLQEVITNAAREGKIALDDPHVFLGPPGVGKTLLAKVAQNEMNFANKLARRRPGRFLEVLCTTITKPEDLDAVVLEAAQHPGSTLFLDELHALDPKLAERLNPLLVRGHRYQPVGQPMRTLPPFTIMGATTNFGDCHPAFQRRFVQHDFVLMSKQELKTVVQRRGAALKFPMEPSAIELLVDRTHHSGAPWEALRWYFLAVNTAKYRKGTTVTRADVQRVFDRHEVDQYGLGKLDRQVIAAVFTQPKGRIIDGTFTVTHWSVAEDTLIGMVGVDRHRWRNAIRPKLFARGLMCSRQGQALTQKTVEWYGHLRPTE